MKVLHAYCLNYNIGDYGLGIGVKNILRQYLDIELIGETNLQGRYFDKYYINEVVNKRYDLLVIGGGGIIHGAHWPNGWFWLIEKDLIKSIKIPFIVYGAGNNYFSDNEIPIKAVKHLEETNKQAKFFSVRNDGSYERVLRQTGIEAFEVPDPGFHIAMDKRHSYTRPIKGEYIVIQVANDKVGDRYGGETDRKRLMLILRNVTKRLAKDYVVVLAPHVLEDVAMSHEIADGIRNAIVWDFGYFAFDHIREALAYYKYAKFVIAMRGHAQIFPISFNVPVISLENHPKHAGLMKKLDLEKYNISIKDIDLEMKLNRKISEVIDNRATIVTCYEKINSKILNQTNKSFEEIKHRIGVDNV